MAGIGTTPSRSVVAKDIRNQPVLDRQAGRDERPPPAVETPDDDDINLFASGGTEQFLPPWTCRGA
jgi:hypothetical protein